MRIILVSFCCLRLMLGFFAAAFLEVFLFRLPVIIPHLFVVGIVSSGTHSGSYGFAQLPTSALPSGETQRLSPDPESRSSGQLPARQHPGHMFQCSAGDHSPTSFQPDFTRVI